MFSYHGWGFRLPRMGLFSSTTDLTELTDWTDEPLELLELLNF